MGDRQRLGDVLQPAGKEVERDVDAGSRISKLIPRTASTSTAPRRNVPVVVLYVRRRSTASTTDVT